MRDERERERERERETLNRKLDQCETNARTH